MTNKKRFKKPINENSKKNSKNKTKTNSTIVKAKSSKNEKKQIPVASKRKRQNSNSTKNNEIKTFITTRAKQAKGASIIQSNIKIDSVKRSKGRPRLKPNVNKNTTSANLQSLSAPSTSNSTRTSKTNSTVTTKGKNPKIAPLNKSSNLKKNIPTKKKPVKNENKSTIKKKEKTKNILNTTKATQVKMDQKESLVKNKAPAKLVSKKLNKKQNSQKRMTRSKPEVLSKRRHRVASLNASAKVKLLCENDRDSTTVKNSSNVEAGSNSVTNTKNNAKSVKKASTTNDKRSNNVPKKSQSELDKSNRISHSKPTAPKRRVNRKKIKRKHNSIDSDVEIIDTRRCKRMASLNASAMMAATYLPETRNEKSLVPANKPQPPRLLDPLSNVTNTIDEVVRQWSSTVEHFERSVDIGEQQCKTTVKTTVKHVKLSGNNTVVETISTQYEQQNIIPEPSSSQSHSKRRPQKKTLQISDDNVNNSNQFSSSTSAFTPCSSSTVHSTSIESILSQRQNSFTTSSFNVKNFDSQSNIKDNVFAKTQNKRTKKSKPSSESSSSHSNGKSKPRSFIRKYEVKTIQTRLESSSVNTTVAHHNSNNFVFNNNSASSSFVNLSASVPSAQANNGPHMPYSLPNTMPFQFIPVAPNQHSHQTHAVPFVDHPPINYINLTNINAPIYHYQPMTNSYPTALNSGTNVVPFLQLCNPTQYSYNVAEQRSNHPLVGLSYSTNNNTTLYQTPNPVFNLFPPSQDSSGCTFIHRPVSCHPQSGSIPPINSSTSYLNNSIFASPPVFGNLNATNNSNIFQYPLVRPQVSTVRQVNVPFGQSTLLFQSPINSTNTTATPLTTIITPCKNVSELNSDISSTLNHSDSPVPNDDNEDDVSLTINNDIIENGSSEIRDQIDVYSSSNAQSNTSDMTSDETSTTSVNMSESNTNPPNGNSKLNRSKKDHSKKASLETLSLRAMRNNTKKSSRSKLNRPAISINKVTNGIDKNLNNSSHLLNKKSKTAKNMNSLNQNGIRTMLSMKNSHRPSNQDYKISTKKSSIQNEKNKLVTSHSSHDNVPIFNKLSVNNGHIKKKSRPIIHGWSWEGDPFDRHVFLNVSIITFLYYISNRVFSKKNFRMKNNLIYANVIPQLSILKGK